MKTSQEPDRLTIMLEETLAESGKKITRLEAENTQLKKSLLKKDRTVEELSRYRSQMEADLKAIVRRLESSEKENASLKYEIHVLDRELEIRHGEREFNRRVSEAAQKQHRESAEKIERLESECRRLRSLVQKRLPGPTALTRMKNEVKVKSGKASSFSESISISNAYLGIHSPGTLSDKGSDGRAESITNGYMNLMDDFAEMEKLAYHSTAASDIGSENKCNDSSTAIQKIIELLEGIRIVTQGDDEGNSETYMVRVFRCETVEYCSVLKQFLGTCNELLMGKGNLEQFGLSVASNLEWVLNHCFSIQDVSDYGGDMKCHQPKTEEGKGLILKLASKELSVIDIEGRLQSENGKVESFMIQLKDSKDLLEDLESQEPNMSRSEDDIGDQAEKHKMKKQEIETQLEGTNPECKEPREEISLLENDMENYDNSYQESDDSCNDLKTQLEGEKGKETTDDKKQLQNDMEITTASEKLAECQETLRNLGKQLKALASPRDAALFDKFETNPVDTVITIPSMSTPQRTGSQRLSLLDNMLAEDNNTTVQIGDSTRTKDAADTNEMCGDTERNVVAPMAIVPSKKKDNRSLFKKLIWWQRKGRSKKNTILASLQ